MGSAFSNRATKAFGAAMDTWSRDDKDLTPTDLITEVQLEEFKAAFLQFDKDRSGYIDLEELRSLCAWVGHDVGDSDLHNMMALADSDGSGKIDFWEFATLMAHKMGDRNPDKALQTAFAVFDTDGDGTISSEEIKQVMLSMGEQNVSDSDVNMVLADIDENQDGTIEYAEFCRVVTKEMHEANVTLF